MAIDVPSRTIRLAPFNGVLNSRDADGDGSDEIGVSAAWPESLFQPSGFSESQTVAGS